MSFNRERALRLFCFDSQPHAVYPGLCEPFMYNSWRVATNGKGALFLKHGYVATPTLRTPVVIGLAKNIEKAVSMAAKRLVVTRLPKATYHVDYCTFCNLDGCDECNERGFEFYPADGCQYWLEYNGEYYLFCLDLLHRLDEFVEVEYVIMPPTDASKPFMTMGVFILPNREGFAVIMSMTPGTGSPKRPRTTQDATSFNRKPITTTKGI